MDQSQKPIKFIRTKKLLDFLANREKMLLERKDIIMALNIEGLEPVPAEECPSVCEMVNDVQDALFQIADSITLLRISFQEKGLEDFNVTFPASFDTATELKAVTGGRCGGLGLDWDSLDGKPFSQCLTQIMEWVVSCANAL
jgi:hypothetical protein